MRIRLDSNKLLWENTELLAITSLTINRQVWFKLGLNDAG